MKNMSRMVEPGLKGRATPQVLGFWLVRFTS